MMYKLRSRRFLNSKKYMKKNEIKQQNQQLRNLILDVFDVKNK